MYIFKTDPRHENPNYQYSPEEIRAYIQKLAKMLPLQPKLILIIERLDAEFEKAKKREALIKKHNLA